MMNATAEQTDIIRFDYTQFLGVSSRGHRWRFVDVIYSIAPIFATLWQQELTEARSAEQILWESALDQLSSTHSDEKNLLKLLKLAKSQHIKRLEVSLPYVLEAEQIATIVDGIEVEVLGTHDELWTVTL
ncbi:hypothetical protein [Vibrio rarus]|uniref:hypothetical protein n=1 Tax=Vibrio rarus TaxID=413403 RepID=UPI0021C35D1C|nr:hypothetical protein [Vibrio rarus]